MQFGPGSQLAAQCVPVLPPGGWRPWTPELDGPVPDTLAARARALADDPATELGATEAIPLTGVTALIRVEPRLWQLDQAGALTQGCFRAGAIYLPIVATETITPPTERSKWEKAVTVLTVASLAVGTIATLLRWGSK
jgi:hypothetical protein